VRTTTPLTFGKHVQVPSVACTIEPDGSMVGSFEIKIVKIRFLNEASIKCKVTKAGIEIEQAKLEVPFGRPHRGKDNPPTRQPAAWSCRRTASARGSRLR
jgi:hypothetical protein